MVRRSVLFSPGDQPDLLRKAPESDADTVVFDLEDAVTLERKADARDAVCGVLADFDPSCEVCVRVNPVGLGAEDDISCVVAERIDTVDTVVLPKVSGTDDVRAFQTLLTDEGLSLPVLPILETAGGILDAAAVAETDPVDGLVLGAEDLAADIGASRTTDGDEITYARQRVVLAAAAADIDAIDTLYTDYTDTDGLAADTARAVQFGFDGKLAIHPDQVPVINDCFRPDESDIEWARRVLAAEAKAEGSGVFAVDGEMIDEPLLRQARTILERAETDE